MTKPIMNQFQPSITEWFEAIGDAKDAEALRLEDNQNRERLEVLYQTIGAPYERPVPLPARELKDLSPAFRAILDERGDEFCAIRLVPKRADLPKLRDRGRTIRRCYEDWFLAQDIVWDEYTAYVCPHSETLEWSATFVVNHEAIFGEIVEGMHAQLTQGETEHPVYRFHFDFQNWSWSERNEEVVRQVERMIAALFVADESKRGVLTERLQATFSHGYLQGYFETTVWPGDKLHFIDYNRLLSARIPTPSSFVSTDSAPDVVLCGTPTSPGVVRGSVVIVSEDMLSTIAFSSGSILVCDNTDVRYLPLMKQAAGFVTNRGSLLSHASIVARELKKPCVVATKYATEVLKNGDIVEVDGSRGIIFLQRSE